MYLQGVYVCLVFYLICPDNIGGLWWAVGSPLVMDLNSICRKSRRLAGKQHEICRKRPEIVTEVVKGAKMALGACQYQFRDRKWNCTSNHRSFGKILQLDTRETAFVFAMTAAGVVFSVTQACSMGLVLHQCRCVDHRIRDMTNDQKWEWGGCGDDVQFGYRISRDFMDARRKKKRQDIRSLIHLHNNEAGRLAVVNYMRKECRCHGLSGSCTLKTCWKKMPIFFDVGRRLKEKYDGAVKVTGSNDGYGQSLMPEGKTIKAPGDEDLIYTEKSPNFCRPSRRYGSLGTKDRECNPKDDGVGGCKILCCDRGYKKISFTLRENCKCVFKWCCEVECETCVTTKTVYRCL